MLVGLFAEDSASSKIAEETRGSEILTDLFAEEPASSEVAEEIAEERLDKPKLSPDLLKLLGLRETPAPETYGAISSRAVTVEND